MEPEILRLTLRQLLSRVRLLILVGLALLPPLLAFLYSFSRSSSDPDTFLTGLYSNLLFTVVAPVVALAFAAAALGSEIEDGTIVYLLLKPVPRWRIALSKLVVAAVTIAVFDVVCVYATALALREGSEMLGTATAFAVAAVCGGVVYTAIFTYLGAITSRSLIVGLLYVFVWEGVVTRLFSGARILSVGEYMRGLADAMSTLPDSVFDAGLTGERALIGCIVVALAFGALAVQRMRTLELAG